MSHSLKKKQIKENRVCPLPSLLPKTTNMVKEEEEEKKTRFGCLLHPAGLSSLGSFLVVQPLFLCGAALYRWDFNLALQSDAMEKL